MTTMKASTYSPGQGFEVRDVPMPTLMQGDLLLRVEATSICGSDTKIIRHGHRRLQDGQPIILGHEFVGTIVETCGDVGPWTSGVRVGVAPNIGCGNCDMCARGKPNMCPAFEAYGITFDGAHAEYVRVPRESVMQGSVVQLSDRIAPLAGALAEPLSCVLNAARETGIEPGDSVLVYGAGPMGQLHLMVASHIGAGRVISADLNDDRLRFAKRAGATDTINNDVESVKDWLERENGGKGVDVVIIAVPVPQLQGEALDILAPFGRLCNFAGWSKTAKPVTLDTNAVHYRNLRITGTTGGAPRDYRDAVRLIEGGVIDVSRIVSDVFSFHAMDKAYELALNGGGMKIAIAADKHLERSGGEAVKQIVTPNVKAMMKKREAKI